jgi:hypothetical protein
MNEVRKISFSSFTKLASGYYGVARFVDELPILNVDDELLDWGASIATTFRTMAIAAQKAGGVLNLAEANKALAVVNTPSYYTAGVGGYVGGYGWGYQYTVPTTTSTTVSNYGQINNIQIMTKEQEAQYRRETWKNMDAATNELRRKMVKKYNVEF